MTATVTNINGDYHYIKENIINVLYAHNAIVLTILEDGELNHLTYSAKEVIININE